MSAATVRQPLAAAQVLPLVLGIGAATALRSAAAGGAAAASTGAGVIFAAAMAGLALAAGWRPGAVRAAAVLLGIGGAAVLIAAPLARGGIPRLAAPGLGVLTVWAPAVVLVAASEEILLRGVLFSAIESWAGGSAALLMTAGLFALIHLPLYGAAALPLDFAVGIWLGALRRLSGGVLAPAVAHAIADLAGAWIV